MPTPTRTGYTFSSWYTATSGGSLVGAGGASYSPTGSTAAITIYAVWTADTNAITYDNQGATTAQTGGSTTYTTAAAIATIPNVAPLKTGYTFNGWYTASSDGTRVNNGSYTPASPYGGVTLYAQWRAIYTITFDSMSATSGSAPSTLSYTVGTSFTKPGNPGSLTKPGWIFTGWIDSNGTFVTDSYLPTSSTTFSARWEAGQYLILYDAYDGRGWWRSSWHSSGNAPVTLLVPTRNGWTFDGWFNLGTGPRLGDASNSYLTYTPNMACNNYPICNTIWAAAKWSANTYTISFDSNTATSGSVPANLSWTGGQAATALPLNTGSLTKPFYTFGGWSATSSESTKVTSYATGADKTFYAIWTPTSYRVTFNSTVNELAISPTSATSTAGSLITLPTAPSRTGYTFTGWYDAATGGRKIGDAGATYLPNSATTLYARWSANSNTVTFNKNDGSGVTGTQSITSAVATALSNSTPFTRAGYTFTGWTTNADGSGTAYANGQSIVITAPLDLYARWSANTNTVIFKKNDGTAAASGQSIRSGVATALSPNPYTRAGWKFDGWTTNADGSGSAYANSAQVTITAGMTLWAKWSR